MRPLVAGVLACLLAVATTASPAHAVARKCAENRESDAPYIAGKVMVMINGVMMGDSYGGVFGIAYVDGDDIRAVLSQDIFEIRIACLEHIVDSRPVVTQVISVVTLKGAERMARQYLRDLAELQASFREERGRFARNLDELRFFVRRGPLPLVLEATDTSWAATITQAGITCSAAAELQGASSPVCVDATGKRISIARSRSAVRAALKASPVGN